MFHLTHTTSHGPRGQSSSHIVNMLVLGLVEVPWWGLILLTILGCIIYSCRDFNYFRRQGIPSATPYPIIGTSLSKMKESVAYQDMKNLEVYAEFGYWGEFFGSKPSLIVFDAEMLSEILVKQFSSFTNMAVFKVYDEVWDNMLGNTMDAHWKHLRKEMAPAFTTGKLKKMNPEINECARCLTESLFECAKQHTDIQIEEYFTGYTIDVIATTSFGIKVNSQKDRHNNFVLNSKRILDLNPASPGVFIPSFLPEVSFLLSRLGIPLPFYPKELTKYFDTITRESMEMRKSNTGQTRTDFIQMMVEAQKKGIITGDEQTEIKDTYSGMTTQEIMANAMLFFAAGFETTKTTLSFLFYNLAQNQDCQERLVDEINRVVGEKDDVDLTMLKEMPYLDKCLNESLRMYPILVRISRRANQDVTIKGVFIRKGLYIEIPTYAIHHDPKTWPDPEKFDPERFSTQNKQKQNPYHFLPFGSGPRLCIGMRLALQELKVATIHVLRKVKITTCEKTQIPPLFDASAINLLIIKGGMWLKLRPREQE